MSTCGAENEAIELLGTLLVGEDHPIPVYDLENPEFDLPGDMTSPIYGEISKFTIGELTTREVGGAGSFDALMEGVKVHLKEEFDKNRITGAEYAKAYVALTQAAIGGGVQYLLGKDQAYWASVQAQVAAITGRIQMRIATTELAASHYKAKTAKSEYALSKMKLSTESINYCIADFQLNSMLPMQLLKLTSEKDGQIIQNNTGLYQLNSMLPMQLDKLTAERDGQLVQNAGVLVTNAVNTYNLENILPQQKAKLIAEEDMTREQIETQRAQTVDTRTDGVTPIAGVIGKQQEVVYFNLTQTLPAQLNLLKEQGEVQRSQTLDVRADGQAVVGSVGKQKALYDQQITSYKRDSEHKAAKLFTDAWITQKTLDEGLLAPNGFTNASLDGVLTTIKTNNNLA